MEGGRSARAGVSPRATRRAGIVSVRRGLLVCVLFVLLALPYHRAVFAHFATALPHRGDPALNAWILSWNLHALAEDPAHLWDANIFHPHRLTLAYSENLLAPSLMVLPVRLFTANPVILYHAALLCGVILSGVGGYLLGYHLTRSFWAAVVPGIAFAFCPFKLGHTGHLQMQHGAWIAFALWAFLVYRERVALGARHRRYPLAAAAVCLALQFASNMYYVLFLATVLLLWQVLVFRGTPAGRRGSAIADGALFWAVSALLLLPLALPYLRLQREMGFTRPLHEVLAYSADIRDYFAYNGRNRWFGDTGLAAAGPETSLTPGAVLLLLATFPLWLRKPSAGLRVAWRRYRSSTPALFVVDALIVCAALVLAAVYTLGGIHIRRAGETVVILGVKLTAENPANSVYLLLILFIVRALLTGWWPRVFAGQAVSRRALFWWLAGFALLMSLGPDIFLFGRKVGPGPYRAFYALFPGYDGIRAPARFAVFVTLGLSVIAAMNLRRVFERRRGRWLPAALPLPAVLLALEYASVSDPMRYPYYPPAVCDWLRTAEPGGVIEMSGAAASPDPLEEVGYVLHSVTHWQHLFNGYSGYAPPAYHVARHGLTSFPGGLAGSLLNRLGIRYVVVHDCPEDLRGQCIRHGFRLVGAADGACVFAPPPAAEGPDIVPVSSPPIPVAAWTVAASPRGADANRTLRDGDPETSWQSLDEPAEGAHIEIALQQPAVLEELRLHFGPFAAAFPRGFELQGRGPDNVWRALPSRHSPLEFLDSALETPRNPVLRIRIDPVRLHGLRLVVTEYDPAQGVAVADIELR